MVKKSFKSVEVGPQVGPPWFFPVFPGGSALRGSHMEPRSYATRHWCHEAVGPKPPRRWEVGLKLVMFFWDTKQLDQKKCWFIVDLYVLWFQIMSSSFGHLLQKSGNCKATWRFQRVPCCGWSQGVHPCGVLRAATTAVQLRLDEAAEWCWVLSGAEWLAVSLGFGDWHSRTAVVVQLQMISTWTHLSDFQQKSWATWTAYLVASLNWTNDPKRRDASWRAPFNDALNLGTG
jgi:hypothetical protein